MTLREAFEAMRLDDRPVEYVDRYEQFYYDGHPIPDSLAESAICWAMVKALASDGYEPMFTRYGVCLGQIVYDDIYHAYAAAFPKEKE